VGARPRGAWRAVLVGVRLAVLVGRGARCWLGAARAVGLVGGNKPTIRLV